jgi:hypothetical protein
MERLTDGRIVLTENELAEYHTDGYEMGYKSALEREQDTEEIGLIRQEGNQNEAMSRTEFLKEHFGSK